jgi:parallel beta-helix repeat protein
MNVLRILAVAVFLSALPALGIGQTTWWYVDDDAPNDPGPGDPMISDPDEDGSPQHPFDAIQEGLDAAADGHTVIVLPSTYSPPGAYVENIVFPARAITLRSINPQDPGLVEVTVIRAVGGGSVVTFGPGTPSDAVIDGFSVEGGNAMLGGGILCESASPTVMNCVIEGNTAVDRGAGIFCDNGSAPVITNCALVSNTGGGLGCQYSSPTIVNCRIEGN